jgi:sugar phosphate isomerase/epimerase
MYSKPDTFVAVLAIALLGSGRPVAAADANLNCHDGSARPPRLQLVLNLWGLGAYPTASAPWPEEKKVEEARAAGFDAFDVWGSGAKDEDVARWKGLATRYGLDVGVEFGPNGIADADEGIATARRLGSVYLDAHAASYFLPERDAEALLRGLVDRARGAGMPLVIQTHRGRVTQDLLRAVGYAKAIPDLRFDVDFSHYLVAGELTGPLGPEAQAAFDVLVEHAIMLDGRFSNGEQVQVDFTNPAYRAHVERTSALWKRVMVRWLRGAQAGDVFPFRVELGPPDYAILAADGREISDRWALQKQMKALVERLWNEAVAETGKGEPHGVAR